MKVILSQDVPNLGNKDEIKEVSGGYARNFLIPRGLAVLATPKELAKISQKTAEKEGIVEKKKSYAEQLKDKVGKIVLSFKARASKEGKLYASITPKKIAKKLGEHKITVDEKKIKLAEPIKKVGEYKAVVELNDNIKATLKISVKPT
jgi:large subunit ribosomal protein L9